MKKSELFQVLNTIDQVGAVKTNVKFAYALAKNRKMIQTEVDTLRDIMKPSAGFEEFERRRIELCNSMCEKDDEGKPITKNQTFVMPDTEAFEKEFATLKDEYKDILEEYAQKRAEVDVLLQEEVDIDFYQIGLDLFPDQLTSAQMHWLMPLVKE